MKKKNLSFVIMLLFLAGFVFAAPVKLDDLQPAKKPEGRPSVAVVLAGGGAKGFAHLPIMEYMDQLDIPIDMIIGTSIGSIVGGFYSAGYSALEIVNDFSDVDWTPMFADATESPYEGIYGTHGAQTNILAANFSSNFRMALGKGLSNGQNVYELFKEKTIKYPSDMSFDDLPIPFRAVATDMLTGDAIILQDGDLAEAMRASMSLPAVFEPIEMDGYYFMDGGLRYNLAINVAKKMGYDIIIGIDISQHVRDNPETFSSNPAIAILNTITISQYTVTMDLYKEATLIITPDISNFGTLDFQKSKIIYEEGKKALSLYKDDLENIRKTIYPHDYDSNGNRISSYKAPVENGIYKNKENLKISGIQINDCYPQDEKYIRNSFEKINKNNFSADGLHDFFDDVYMTGNYKSVRPRVIKKDGEYVVDLQLKKNPPKEFKVIIGADFEQIFSTSSAVTTNLEIDLQARGFTGIGSMLSLHGTAITDFGAQLFYMQPFNPYIFIDMSAGILNERYPSEGNTSSQSITNFLSWIKTDFDLNFGIRTKGGNLLKIGGFYSIRKYDFSNIYYDYHFIENILFKDSEYFWENDIDAVIRPYYGLNIAFDLDTMDYSLFGRKGVRVDTSLKLIVPVTANKPEDLLLRGQAEISAAVPFGDIVSLRVSGMGGTEFLNHFKNDLFMIPVEGFNAYDRLYFPTITTNDEFGTNLVAARVDLQFQPMKHLTIFGGDLFIILEGTAGNVTYQWKDMFAHFWNPETERKILWTGSLGVGVRIRNQFGLMLRAGVGSTRVKQAVPFFCFDIGDFLF